MIDGSAFLSAPYEWLLHPILPWLFGSLVALCMVGIAADLAQPRSRTERGRLASLAAAVLLFTVGRGWLNFDSWACAALVLAAYAVLIAHAGRFGWIPCEGSPPTARSAWWVGGLIIAAAFALKCLQLEAWPPNLNSYSAMTGEEGLRALAGEWPERFFGVRAYPLAEGGKSPLHLPLLWASMKMFGGTVLAVRFAEVVGSTALLVILWIWLRGAMPGLWAPLALGLFAFSPWHLAQSRFGSFFSVSVTLALVVLWLGERGLGGGKRSWPAWLGLGVCAGAISWLYAPLQVLYAFVGLVAFLGLANAGRRWQPLLVVAGFAAVGGIQLAQSGVEGFMRSDFGQLATDTVIWRKTAEDVVSKHTQPLPIIADNFARNIAQWYREIFKESGILVWWAPALGIGLLYALADLMKASTRARALYYLIGILPPLLIFPLHRRSLIIWPLVYVAGVRFCREVVAAADAIRWQPWARRVAVVTTGGFLLMTSLHGLGRFAVGNPAGLVYPYFGPPFRFRMIDEAKQLLPYYHLIFVNPSTIKHPLRISLYEPARATNREQPYKEIEIDEGEQRLDRFLEPDQRNCFIYLNDEPHRWVSAALAAGLPEGRLIERRDPGGPALYSLYFVPAN